MLVLVVDDEPDIVSLLKIALAEDFRVISASSGREAMTIAHRERPDVILLDRRLPDGDGLELLAGIRNDPATSGVAIILITGLTPPKGDLPRGVAGYIGKPFDPIGLPARIRAILETRGS